MSWLVFGGYDCPYSSRQDGFDATQLFVGFALRGKKRNMSWTPPSPTLPLGEATPTFPALSSCCRGQRWAIAKDDDFENNRE